MMFLYRGEVYHPDERDEGSPSSSSGRPHTADRRQRASCSSPICAASTTPPEASEHSADHRRRRAAHVTSFQPARSREASNGMRSSTDGADGGLRWVRRADSSNWVAWSTDAVRASRRMNERVPRVPEHDGYSRDLHCRAAQRATAAHGLASICRASTPETMSTAGIGDCRVGVRGAGIVRSEPWVEIAVAFSGIPSADRFSQRSASPVTSATPSTMTSGVIRSDRLSPELRSQGRPAPARSNT